MKVKVFLAILVLLTASGAAFSWSDFFQGAQGEAALINLEGPIQASSSTGLGAPTAITPDQVRELNQEAIDRDVDAVVYEINSQGGAVVASKDVMRSIDSMEMTTICRLRDVGASGAYMAALGCDEIVADSATFTGSVGVTGSYLEFSELLENLGINYVNVTAGEHKEVGSPFEELSEEEERILRNQIDTVHSEFYTEVDERRNLTDDQLEEVQTGQVFLGSQAEELGLVDHLGGREEAFDRAENVTGQDLRFSEVETAPEFNMFSLLGLEISPLLQNLESRLPFRAEL